MSASTQYAKTKNTSPPSYVPYSKIYKLPSGEKCVGCGPKKYAKTSGISKRQTIQRVYFNNNNYVPTNNSFAHLNTNPHHNNMNHNHDLNSTIHHLSHSNQHEVKRHKKRLVVVPSTYQTTYYYRPSKVYIRRHKRHARLRPQHLVCF